MAKFKEAEVRLFKGVCMHCSAKNPVDATLCRRCGKPSMVRRKKKRKAAAAQSA